MKEKGYPAPMAAAVMSSASTLAIIIPPSIPMILYAVMAETSVVQMFVAGIVPRSEEHTSELQSLMRISYAVFCLKKKINNYNKSTGRKISQDKQQHTPTINQC